VLDLVMESHTVTLDESYISRLHDMAKCSGRTKYNHECHGQKVINWISSLYICVHVYFGKDTMKIHENHIILALSKLYGPPCA